MGRADQTDIAMRIVIERPVIGVLHSLQDVDGRPLDPKRSPGGEPIAFDFAIRVAPGPKFFGDQVRREGPVRRFVYIRVGDLAGDQDSPWSRRMKIDIHEVGDDLLRAAAAGSVIETTVDGTLADGSPACGTLLPIRRRVVAR